MESVETLTYDVGQEQFGGVLAVVPVTVVNPLSQQLNRRLCAVLLLGRHVQIVNKRNTLLTERRPVHALSSSNIITDSDNCDITQ